MTTCSSSVSKPRPAGSRQARPGQLLRFYEEAPEHVGPRLGWYVVAGPGSDLGSVSLYGCLNPKSCEAVGHLVILLCGDAGLVADDGVSLDYGPLVPALERDLKVVAECSGYGFRAGACEHGAVDGDRLPAAKPSVESRHDRKLGQFVVSGSVNEGPGRAVGPQLDELQRTEFFGRAKRDGT